MKTQPSEGVMEATDKLLGGGWGWCTLRGAIPPYRREGQSVGSDLGPAHTRGSARSIEPLDPPDLWSPGSPRVLGRSVSHTLTQSSPCVGSRRARARPGVRWPAGCACTG